MKEGGVSFSSNLPSLCSQLCFLPTPIPAFLIMSEKFSIMSLSLNDDEKNYILARCTFYISVSTVLVLVNIFTAVFSS